MAWTEWCSLSTLLLILSMTVVNTTAQTDGWSTICFKCSNTASEPNPGCSATRPISSPQAVTNTTCPGPCFTMADLTGSSVRRGCTSEVPGLAEPELLPEDGCYNWQNSSICICRMGLCNAMHMGASLGIDLYAHITTTKAPTTKAPALTTTKEPEDTDVWTTSCFACSSVGAQTNPACLANRPIDYRAVSMTNCTGPCYTVTDTTGTMVVRGCSAQLFGPTELESLPFDGCYDFQGGTMCICRMAYCNAVPIGQSSGTELLPQETTTAPTTTTTKATATSKPDTDVWNTLCLACSNVGSQTNSACLADRSIDPRAVSTTNCTGPCHTVTDPTGKMVVRGCSAQLFGPTQLESLPQDGCYDFQGGTMCICRMAFCNSAPIGQSTGTDLFPQETTTTRPTTPTPKPGTTTPDTGEWSTHCFTCSSNRAQPNPACPLNGTVTNFEAVADSTCTAPCYTMVVPSVGMVMRGCSTAMPGLPNPLPEDGCYDYQGGSTICICRMAYCNRVAIGKSSGVALDANPQTGPTTPAPPTTLAPTTTTGEFSTQCLECMSFSEGEYVDWCPGNGSVKLSIAYYGECDSACFTKSIPDDERVVVRGCTATEWALPSPLPADGCYDWNGATYCICRDAVCNKGPLGKSSGVSLDAHIEDMPGTFDPDGPLQCYQCLSMDEDGNPVAACPRDGRVSSRTYHGNCTGACIQRTYKDVPGKIGRGCTDEQYAMPNPLPKDGCYDWMGETWCVCTENGCNGKPMGVSSGVAFDAHLDDIPIPEVDGVMQCYQCVNYDEKWNYYPQCPKDARVTNAFKSNCTGRCYIRSYDWDDRLVARGCTTDQPALPRPLPEDGCYSYYSSVWCICSSSGCNRNALGKSNGIELDAHIKDSGSSVDVSKLYGFMFISLMCLMKFWLAP